MYGPTVGDRVRLADTDLFIEVEADRTVYGEEVKFGGGKVIRDGMGQGSAGRADGAAAGGVLAVIDRTVTGAGARVLRARLGGPVTDPDAIIHFCHG